MNEYELVEMDDGEIGVLCSGGKIIPAPLLELLLELSERHPEFFEHWIALAENHAMHSESSLKA